MDNNENTILSFSTTIKTLDVIIDGKKCLLREMTGDERTTYMDKGLHRVKMGPTGKIIGIKTTKGIGVDILSCTLYYEGKLISEKEISGWPGTVVEKLAAASMALSGIETDKGDDDKEEKND